MVAADSSDVPFGNRPCIVGIAGGAGAGKTVFANRLSQAFDPPALVLGLDTYYDTERVLGSGSSQANWDHPDAIDYTSILGDLDRVRGNRPIEAREYDYIRHCVVLNGQPVVPTDVVIVEGVLLFANASLRDRCDCRIFVDTEEAVRLTRRIDRDRSERGQSVAEIMDWHAKMVSPMHEMFVAPSKRYAHLVVCGADPTDTMVAVALRSLKSVSMDGRTPSVLKLTSESQEMG